MVFVEHVLALPRFAKYINQWRGRKGQNTMSGPDGPFSCLLTSCLKLNIKIMVQNIPLPDDNSSIVLLLRTCSNLYINKAKPTNVDLTKKADPCECWTVMSLLQKYQIWPMRSTLAIHPFARCWLFQNFDFSSNLVNPNICSHLKYCKMLPGIFPFSKQGPCYVCFLHTRTEIGPFSQHCTLLLYCIGGFKWVIGLLLACVGGWHRHTELLNHDL